MDSKYILGSYLNMANDNFINTIHLLAKKLKTPKGEDQNLDQVVSYIPRIFDNSNQVPETEQIVEFYFPWLEALKNANGFGKSELPELKIFYKDVLCSFAKNLKDLRDNYTHYIHKTISYHPIIYKKEGNTLQSSLPKALLQIYDASIKLAKERFLADENAVTHLRRYKMVGKKVVRKTEADHFLYLLEKDHLLTEKGIAFFTSLFLNRKYGYLMLKQLKGFKQGGTLAYRLTLETFLAYSNIKPVERLKADKYSDVAFIMDLLGEISKIPKELYHILPETYILQYKDKLHIELNEDISLEAYCSRGRNRFDQLALTYLDRLEDFKQIGFYTYLGNYIHNGYMKARIDGTEQERYLSEKMYGCCKDIYRDLSAIVAKQYNIEVKDSTETSYMLPNDFQPHVIRAYPHYVINNNNIGIRLLDEGESGFPILENRGTKNVVPHFWMSKYDLPALLFYAYLRSDNRFASKCEKTIDEILRGYLSKSKDKKSKQAEKVSVLMLRRIDKAIIWTQTKLNEAEKQRDNKKSFKIGEKADILAHDMLWLQPAKESKDKVSGANFRALQTSLAFFRRNELDDIFKRSFLIGGNNPHPFLSRIKINTMPSLFDFYLVYMRERLNYWEKIKLKLLKGHINVSCHPLRKLNHEKPVAQENKKEGQPVFLPRGIFNDVIKKCLQKTKLGIYLKDQGVEKRPWNVAYQILKFHEIINDDDIQEFYEQPRKYAFLDENHYLTLEERTDRLKNLKPECIEVSKANDILEKEDYLLRKSYNQVCDNESAIRLYQVQDILLFMIAQRLCNEIILGDKQEKKEKIVTSFSLTLKNLSKKFDQPVHFEIKMNNVNLFSDTDFPVKNFGKMLRLKKDARFISYDKLFKGQKQNINYNDYCKEEEYFDICRIQMVKLCHELEEKLLEKGIITESPNSGYYPFADLVQRIINQGVVIRSSDVKFILEARNMFLHNEYKQYCVNSINSIDSFIAEKVYNLFKQKMDNILGQLESIKPS